MDLLPRLRDRRGISGPCLWSQLYEDTVSAAVAAFFQLGGEKLKDNVHEAECSGVESLKQSETSIICLSCYINTLLEILLLVVGNILTNTYSDNTGRLLDLSVLTGPANHSK